MQTINYFNLVSDEGNLVVSVSSGVGLTHSVIIEMRLDLWLHTLLPYGLTCRSTAPLPGRAAEERAAAARPLDLTIDLRSPVKVLNYFILTSIFRDLRSMV